MKRIAFLVVMACLLLASPTFASWFLYGTVRWDAETIAPDVEIRLLQNGEQKAVTYTNLEGRYGFLDKDISGKPSDYTIEVWANEKKIKTQPLADVSQEGKQDIKL